MKKFLLTLSIVLMTLLLVFLLTSFIVANIHDHSVIVEWRSWGAAIVSCWKMLKKFFVS